MNPIILFERATLVAGLAALVGSWRGYRRFNRSQPGNADNLRAQATVWASAGCW